MAEVPECKGSEWYKNRITETFRERKGGQDRVTQSSPVLCDVDREPYEMSEGDNEIRKGKDSCHGVCLKHVEGHPKPNAVYCHFFLMYLSSERESGYKVDQL